jgi:hypothetical protein
LDSPDEVKALCEAVSFEASNMVVLPATLENLAPLTYDNLQIYAYAPEWKTEEDTLLPNWLLYSFF